MPEDAFHLLQLDRRRNAEHASIAIEAAVRNKDVAMGIKSEKIAEGLNGDDGTGHRIVLRNSILINDFQRFPCTPAQVCQE